MDLITLTPEQIERVTGVDGFFYRRPHVLEIFVRGDDMKDMCGLSYISGGEWDWAAPTENQYIFKVIDNKKWVLTRLKYSI